MYNTSTHAYYTEYNTRIKDPFRGVVNVNTLVSAGEWGMEKDLYVMKETEREREQYGTRVDI